VHILMVTIIGLVVLGLAVGIARLLNRQPADGAQVFIWLWLAASLVNGAYGYFGHDIPLLNEVGAFIVIFGVPAGAAWYLSRRRASTA
jgi:hypothetical protein